MREEVELLEDHARAQPQLADLLALVPRALAALQAESGDLDGPLGRVLQEVDAAQEGALAGAGPPEDDDHLALVDLEIDPRQHLDVAKALVEPFDLHDRVLPGTGVIPGLAPRSGPDPAPRW